MTRLLWRASWRYHRRHSAQAWLMLAGVALGVAVVVAVDVANAAVERALRWSVDAVSGTATHEIVGGPDGIDETLYTRLRLAGWRDIAPRVEGRAELSGQPDTALTVIGADLLNVAAGGDAKLGEGVSGEALRRLLVEPDTAAVSARLAARQGLRVGERLALSVGGATREAEIVALFEPRGEAAAAGLERVVLTDLSTAQEWLGMTGRLSRIDVRLRDEAASARLRAALPAETALLALDQRRDHLLRLSEAFRLNLEAFSLLALAVGMLLIYNAFTFAVVQRRAVIARLRALGVTRGELARTILLEAAVLGLAGAAAGVLAGYALGQGVLRQVVGTVNDLYFTVAVTEVPLPATAWVKGALLGGVTSVLAAAVPVWEAVSAPVRVVLGRADLEVRVRRGLPWLAWAGALLFVAAGAGLWLLPRSLIGAYAALFAMMLGAALLIPAATLVLMHMLRPLAKRVGGLTGGMAVRGVTVSPSRSGVAVAALAVAVSATLGVTIMIDSFRSSVIDWLAQTLRADIYISAGGDPLDPQAVAEWAALPGVEAMSGARRVVLEQADGPVELMALMPAPGSYAGFRFKEGEARTVWPVFLSGGAVLVSESYAYRNGLHAGDELRLRTRGGGRDFPIAGVYYDYGSDRGTVTLSRETYERHWGATELTGVGLYLAPGVEAAAFAERLRARAGATPLSVRSNRDIRAAAMQIFERTFAVTEVLRSLVLVVAVVAVLGALAALILERAREWAILRALGLLPAELWSLVSGETLLMGLAAGVFALPLGLGVAYVLTQVIQPRAFGWTMGYTVDPALLAQSLLLTLLAAAVAALYPAWRVARTAPADALRME